ncbi:hypothetical protein [Ammoniphilus sp. 3BR4]|uniref:hypothetical protein n=1 Tax=Ammoniphilus sp. 3BR4 TaxID=3158265 RepID=UPI003465B1FF
MNHEEEYYEVEYFDDEEYEEARREESARLNRNTVINLENRYGCTLPQFILKAQSSDERADLLVWSWAIRYLVRNEEKIYT